MPEWKRKTFAIERNWDGEPLPSTQAARVDVEFDDFGNVRLAWRAAWPVGPEPRLPPGSCARLWEHSVLEVFLAAERGPYVEFEFGPAGHWLAMYLEAYRTVTSYVTDVDYRWWRSGEWWCGKARLATHKSHRWSRGNAFVISRHGSERRYAAASGDPLARPDFHRHDCYLPL